MSDRISWSTPKHVSSHMAERGEEIGDDTVDEEAALVLSGLGGGGNVAVIEGSLDDLVQFALGLLTEVVTRERQK